MNNSNHLPNLIIAGVPKAATTSLYAYFSKHPDIFVPKKKEINYFRPLRFNNQLKDISNYQKHYLEWVNQKYKLDASPHYIYGGQLIISKMKEVLPDHKVIIILRNPVYRFISYYKFLYQSRTVRDKSLKAFLEKCLSNVEKPMVVNNFHIRALPEGRYINFLRDWKEAYDENLKVIFFEDLITNPQETMAEVAHWLQIDATPFNDEIYTQENKTKSVKHEGFHTYAIAMYRKLEGHLKANNRLKTFLKNVYYTFNPPKDYKTEVDDECLNKLEDFYKESNLELFQYLKDEGMSLPNWHKTKMRK